MRIVPFLIVVILLLLTGCKKDKLEGEKSILQGKWKWVHAIEIKTLLSNGSSSSTTVLASDFPDSYFMEFERKGKVHYIKNDNEENVYRLDIFQSSESTCNVFENCLFFGAHLDNKKEKSFSGEVSSDSLRIQSDFTNLPLKNRIEGSYEYYYLFYFVNIN